MADQREVQADLTDDTSGTSQESAQFHTTSESMEGLATTQELVSDMYKMGTIEDRVSGT